jgi:tryptophan synthase beta chain
VRLAGLAASIREAQACREFGEDKVVLTALCGHGHFDMAAYHAYLSGRMVDEDVPDGRFAGAFSELPQVPTGA